MGMNSNAPGSSTAFNQTLIIVLLVVLVIFGGAAYFEFRPRNVVAPVPDRPKQVEQ